MAFIELSKFDVAERQLLQAIRMFFREEDPISIHTLTEAASQVLRDIGKKRGAKSMIHQLEHVPKEFRDQWFTLISQSKNFFKHADRDPDHVHRFDPVVNEFVIFDSLVMYRHLTDKMPVEATAYTIWFGLNYAYLINKSSGVWGFFEQIPEELREPKREDKSLFYSFIEEGMRSGESSTKGEEQKTTTTLDPT